MKVLSAQQIREADQATIQRQGISSLQLMERAARACTDEICKRYSRFFSFIVIAGPGNNGGDGLAIARQLYARGRQVGVMQLVSENYSNDNRENFEKLKSTGLEVQEITGPPEDLPAGDIFIDALFGTGINKPVQGMEGDLIEWINKSGKTVISIDIPSGLHPDDNRDFRKGKVVNADLTLSFQFPKKSFLIPSSGKSAGEFKVLDIGLDTEFIASTKTNTYFTCAEDVAEVLRSRNRFDHKGTFGRLLIIAGSHGMAGAAILCARAALRAGAGLVRILVPECLYEIMQISVPEAMVIVSGKKELEELPDLSDYDAICCGPGLGKSDQVVRLLGNLIKTSTVPLVLDADALNILSENKTWISFLQPGTILTPHPVEASRLVGKFEDEETRLEELREFSIKNRVVVAGKDAFTCTFLPDGNMFYNSSGTPAIATGGAGDVLAGVISAMRAQGYSPEIAAVAGVFLHGEAGQRAAVKAGKPNVIASEIVEGIKIEAEYSVDQ